MGQYLPGKKLAKKDLSETLIEAEHDHILDCPNAEWAPRMAAMLLDVILLFLLLSGSQSFFEAMIARVPKPAPESAPLLFWALDVAPMVLNYAASVVKISVVYFYVFWSVTQYGGTPGKLLIGLRVVNADTGMRLDLGRLLVRELVGKAASASLLGLGFAMALVRRDGRALHDLMANSVVKRLHGGPT